MSNEDSLPPSFKIPENGLPIFFLQLGSRVSLFLDKVLKQAALTNGTENVFVLTDTNFHLYTGYNCIDVSQFAYGSAAFDGLYRHHSSNPYFFEKSCFYRWFIINAMVKALNIPYFFYADCDVLVMEDLKPVHRRILQEGYEGSTMYFEGDDGHSVTSAHTSFWSGKLLDDFCRFVIEKYSDEQAFGVILKNTLTGKFLGNTNVSDMILLDVFRTERKPNVLNLFTLEDSNICFDFNAGASYNGRRHNFVIHPVYQIKKLVRRGGGLFGKVKGHNAGIPYCRFYTVHFQGYVTKTLIPLYVTTLTTKEAAINSLTGTYNFAARKLKLLKNEVKRKAKALLMRPGLQMIFM